MPQILPLVPFTETVREYYFATTIADVTYNVRAYWNDRDEAAYLDIRDVNDEAIMLGVKVVLGTNLGRTYDDALVNLGALMALDLSGQLRDATAEDFGRRVIVIHATATEIAGAIVAGAGG